jgi:hypothetical protein
MPTTYNAVTLGSSEVQGLINGAAAGDIIQLPALTDGVWDSDSITINKAITIQGHGIGITKVDISGTVLGHPTILITNQTTERIWFKDLTFTDLAGTHDSDETGMHDIRIIGGWGTSYWPVFFKRVRFELTGWETFPSSIV